MIKIEDVEVMGMRKAINSMRISMNSLDESDSIWCANCPNTENEGLCIDIKTGSICNGFIIGKEDMKLCKRLIKAGGFDRKSIMGMIHVQVNVTAPLYWWQEIKQYKIKTNVNLCSIMHTIYKKELTLDDFSHEKLGSFSRDLLKKTIKEINEHRINCTEGGFKASWYQMIQLLPSSFNQMRTIDLNYETLFSIYHERRNHKLDEWVEFCKWIETLPYMKEFIELN